MRRASESLAPMDVADSRPASCAIPSEPPRTTEKCERSRARSNHCLATDRRPPLVLPPTRSATKTSAGGCIIYMIYVYAHTHMRQCARHMAEASLPCQRAWERPEGAPPGSPVPSCPPGSAPAGPARSQVYPTAGLPVGLGSASALPLNLPVILLVLASPLSWQLEGRRRAPFRVEAPRQRASGGGPRASAEYRATVTGSLRRQPQ